MFFSYPKQCFSNALAEKPSYIKRFNCQAPFLCINGLKTYEKNLNVCFSLYCNQRFRNAFAEKPSNIKRFNAYKYHWSDNRVPIVLEVSQGSLDQKDPATNQLLCSYDYKDMEGLTQISDYPGGIAVIHGGFSRLVSCSTLPMLRLLSSIAQERKDFF